MRRRHLANISGAMAIFLAGVVGLGSPGRAGPLGTEACGTLETEHADLVKAGVPEVVKKGVAWGTTNLPSDKLKTVQRFIQLEEQLLFRCGHEKQREQQRIAAAKALEVLRSLPPLPRRKPQAANVKPINLRTLEAAGSQGR